MGLSMKIQLIDLSFLNTHQQQILLAHTFKIGINYYARAFTHLYNSSVFVVTYSSHVVMAKVDFENLASYSWSKNMTCSQFGA